MDLGLSGPSGDIVSQLSGYSRVSSFANALGVDDNTVIPCVFIYPIFSDDSNTFRFDKARSLLEQTTPIKHLIKFYQIGVPVPRVSEIINLTKYIQEQ